MELVLTVLACLLISTHNGEGTVVELDEDGHFNVSWSFPGGKTSTDNITFTMEAATTGWVGLGFSPNGGMSGADIVVAWVDSEGKAFIEDRIRSEDGNGYPEVDESSDVSLVSASEDNGKTRIVFTRKLNTCDKKGDRALNNDTTRLIYAYGQVDPKDNKFSGGDMHSTSNRGGRSVYLLDEAQHTADIDDPEAKSFDLVKDNYEVPANPTTYHCSIHKAPTLGKKHHIIAVEPVITPGNEGLVHHITVYACSNLTEEGVANMYQTESVCYERMMPESFQICREVNFGWGVGGQTHYFPQEAGFPFGTGNWELSPLYYLLEIHYDNPDKKSNKIDSSGLRLHYTPKVRQNDLGSIIVGSVSGIVVPPKQESFQVVGYCDSQCTNNWIPPEGITVVSYFLHAHLLGAGIQVDLYRDGKPYGILASDKNYDFNFQETRVFSKPQKLMPGDSLKVTCTMNSKLRPVMTYGGESTDEEMCLAFLIYYPRRPISSCMSMPGFMMDPSDKFYSKLDVDYRGFTTRNSSFVNLPAVFQNTTWDAKKVETLQNITHETSHNTLCMVNGRVFHQNGRVTGTQFEKLLSEDTEDVCTQGVKDGHDHSDSDDGNTASQSVIASLLLFCPIFLYT